MKILKRNQIIISVIALMLITVGYMNYASSVFKTAEASTVAEGESDGKEVAGIGDARLVNSDNVDDEDDRKNENDADEEDEDDDDDDGISDSEPNMEDSSSISSSNSVDTKQKTVQSSASISNSYFASSRIERDNMYSEMIETYENLLGNDSVPNDQRVNTTNEITNINNKKNSIMIAENLIRNLGFEDVIIFVNDKSVSVIVKAEKLQEADVAQIQNVVCRELNVKADVVHISVRN